MNMEKNYSRNEYLKCAHFTQICLFEKFLKNFTWKFKIQYILQITNPICIKILKVTWKSVGSTIILLIR